MRSYGIQFLAPVLFALPLSPLSGQDTAPEILIEGESITGITVTGGKVGVQGMSGFKAGKWSGDSQTWWTGAGVTDVLTVPFNVAEAGDYSISVGMTKSYNYGIFTFAIDDLPFAGKPLDLYSVEVTNSDEHPLGAIQLAAGGHRLRIRLEGTNPASKGTMFGVDFLRLRRIIVTRAQASIDALLSEHEAILEEQVLVAHRAEVKTLDSSYLAALDRAMTTASKAGRLEEAVAIRDEKVRGESGVPMPEGDEGANPALLPLRATYRTALGRLEEARNLAAGPLIAATDQKFDALQREMTQSGDLEAAVAVREVRKKLTDRFRPSTAPSLPVTVTPATAGELVTSPPPPVPRLTSTELSVENLSGRRFAFGNLRDRKIRPYSIVVFGANGRMRGNESTNESAWSIDAEKGSVSIISSKGQVSTLCDKVRWKDGLLHISGDFLLGSSKVIHAFEEIAPVPQDFPPLTARRLEGRRFEFCYVSDRGPGNAHGVQLADDGKVAGANFPTITTWKVDEQGLLVFFDAENRAYSLFDRIFTFNDGDHLVLEGPMQKDPKILHRLIEQP